MISCQLCWLMLLPWWKMLYPPKVCVLLADVIANCGWWNYHRPAFILVLSSEMLNRTSSQICGRLYLPIFLFRDGLLTFMYKASLLSLMRFWSSLPNMENLSTVTEWPEMLIWSCIGEGALRCSLNLTSKIHADSPIYSWSQSTLSHVPHVQPGQS